MTANSDSSRLRALARAVVLAITCVCSACAAKLPPHVWLPIDNLEAVDFFWWTDMKICQVRVLAWYGPDDLRGQTMTVEPEACIVRLKARGYDVDGVKP